MMPQPGNGRDLEELVDDALAKNTPNAFIDDATYGKVNLLSTVCINRRLDLADRLIAAGATLPMSDEDFGAVINWGRADTIAYLLERGAFPKPYLISPTADYDWETVFVLLDYGADIETKFPRVHNSRVLHQASWLGEASVVRRLLKRGAEVDCRDDQGLTPLLKACDWEKDFQKAHSDTVYWLLTHGADPNAQTPNGETALLLCVRKKQDWFINRTQTAQMLLRYGANPNTVSSPEGPEFTKLFPMFSNPKAISTFGVSALMFAARDNDTFLVRSLLKAGADPTYQLPDGRTARDIAEKYGSKDVLVLLT